MAQFDIDLVSAAFDLAGQEGWRRLSVAAAARRGGLELAEARQHFNGIPAILTRFGRLADAHALTGAMADGRARDRLFDILMRRVDFLQLHRAGVLALMRAAPLDPVLSLCLARANLTSMGWMLEGAGISAQGVRGAIRKRGLLAVWVWTIRSWAGDESEDLSQTMAVLDNALMRADQVATQFSRGGSDDPTNVEIGPDAPFASEPEIIDPMI